MINMNEPTIRLLKEIRLHNKIKFSCIRVPIIEPLDIRTCWEHTPLDYYRYGEYPRFVRPVGVQDRFETAWVKNKPKPHGKR